MELCGAQSTSQGRGGRVRFGYFNGEGGERGDVDGDLGPDKELMRNCQGHGSLTMFAVGQEEDVPSLHCAWVGIEQGSVM